MTETETRAREYLADQMLVLSLEIARLLGVEANMREEFELPPNPAMEEMKLASKMARDIGCKLISSTRVDV